LISEEAKEFSTQTFVKKQMYYKMKGHTLKRTFKMVDRLLIYICLIEKRKVERKLRKIDLE